MIDSRQKLNSKSADSSEAARLRAVEALDILDSPREEGFDRIVALLRAVFRVPIAFVSVIDAHRQWYKACDGLPVDEMPRNETFCQLTIKQSAALVIPDTRLDERSADHPQVTANPFVRFYAGVPLQTRDGHNVGTLCIVDFAPRPFDAEQIAILTDFARVVMAQLELRHLIAEDVLTGALSRRTFRQEGIQALSLAHRHGYALSCVAFDLDHFKTINDRFGHAAGDEVLVAVSRICQKNLRSTDKFGRIGGEEFAILLPHTDRQGAHEAAEKMRTAIEALKFPRQKASVRVTASFGYASMTPQTRDLDALLARADAALYESKGAGRNQSRGWRDTGGAQARRRVFKAGSLEFNNGRSTIDCTIRSLGEDGAGLDVSTNIGIPDQFTLLSRADKQRWPCQVESRTDRHMEVSFS